MREERGINRDRVSYAHGIYTIDDTASHPYKGTEQRGEIDNSANSQTHDQENIQVYVNVYD